MTQGISYDVDIAAPMDNTGSMSWIIEAVKANALRFYPDLQESLTAKGKKVDQLRMKIIGFRDIEVDGAGAIVESPFFLLPQEQDAFAEFVRGLTATGGGDEAESGLEALSLAINSEWCDGAKKRRHVIVVWTDAPAKPLRAVPLPAAIEDRVPKDFNALTDLWDSGQGAMTRNSQRLILFAPDGPGWSDISTAWENVIHHPSRAGEGLSDVDYKTIIESIANSV